MDWRGNNARLGGSGDELEARTASRAPAAGASCYTCYALQMLSKESYVRAHVRVCARLYAYGYKYL